MGILGFSLRKAALTIYFYEGFDHYGEELAHLCKHKISASYLYVNKLTDINLSVIETILCSSFKIAATVKHGAQTVDEYIATIPLATRTSFDQLRRLV